MPARALSDPFLYQTIERAAHWLPAQGPITVFVHHNTLHALESLPFEQAVRRGGQLFGSRAYLPLERYRLEQERGSIRPEDVDAALLDSLGEHAELFVGLLGTRYKLRQALLDHPYPVVRPEQLDWVLAEQRALEQFSPGVSAPQREKMIADTRRWVLGLLTSDAAATSVPAGGSVSVVRKFCQARGWSLDARRAHAWDESTWEALTLELLWHVCLGQVLSCSPPTAGRVVVRHRDVLRSLTGVDCDEWVNELLIRFCVALLDQGLSRWPMPHRELGVMAAFANLYGHGRYPRQRWLRDLPAELRKVGQDGGTALQSIRASLDELGIAAEQVEAFITATLLSLRGFAGMIWQMELRRDRIAHPLPHGALVEFLAIRLILDRLAVRYVAGWQLGWTRPLGELLRLDGAPTDEVPSTGSRSEAFSIFHLAQDLAWTPAMLFNLSQANWRRLLEEIRLFDETERLQVLHRAWERRFRIQALDAIYNHQRRLEATRRDQPTGPEMAESTSRPDEMPEFDVITCIDEREESLRRHLEESAPRCRTWGAAGFFGVAMYYRAADTHQFVPLCPIVVEPQHYVEEVVTFDQTQLGQRRSAARRLVGAMQHRLHAGSRMLLMGAFASLLGALAAIPLIFRVLFPRLAGLFRSRLDHVYAVPPQTVLNLEQSPASTGRESPPIGYSLDEMAAIAERLLRDIGLTVGFSRLVIIVGHGSSTSNNPHESAYDCGACGGGRGGPNARAVAQLANDPRVRSRLRERGLEIPDETYFLGAFHNTCSDQISFADLFRVPASHVAAVRQAQSALHQACALNAHERCRRFESADLGWTPTEALRHVQGRSEDLSEVRPECGHATNALCVVGRRSLTRGLFMDRRAFMQSYDPAQDDAQQTILARILAAVIPVCAGINLEYFFSYVDPETYGCGTKLPHNIAALVGVMNGAASDLRPGLPWQMVEIHQPLRLLVVVEAQPAALLRVMAGNSAIDRLVRGGWIQLATLDPQSGDLGYFHGEGFHSYRPEADQLAEAPRSSAWYGGTRDHLPFAHIVAAGPFARGDKP